MPDETVLMLQDEMAKLVVSAKDLHGMSQGKGRENQRDWFEPRTLELSLSGMSLVLVSTV